MTTPVAQAVCLDFFGRPDTAKALVLVASSELLPVRIAVTERWRSLLAAMSSGIAHMDNPYDPQFAAIDERLSKLGKRTIAFATFDDPPQVPLATAIAYLVGPPPAAWLDALVGTTIVNVT